MDKSINKKRIILTVSIIAACILLISIVSTVSLIAYILNNQDESTDTDSGEENFGLVGKKLWNGLYVDKELYNELTAAEDEKNFKLKSWALEVPSEFIYEGKGYGEYTEDFKESGMLLEKLESLEKEGDDLKYGETLYNGGAPNGSKWTQERYEYKTEQYYGKALLEQYIVNGEFLLEKLQGDIASAKAEKQARQIKMNEAQNGYCQEMLLLFKAIDQGATLKNSAVYFSASKKQLSNLPDEYKGQFVFAHEHHGAVSDN